jgi:hypothetical protein
MSKFVVLIFLALLLSPKQVEAADFSPSTILSRVSDSLVIVRTKRATPFASITMSGQSGTGFIVSSNEQETLICTAKHVVDDDAAVYCTVELKGVEIRATDVTKSDITDAALLSIRPGIKGAVPLKFNLSPDDSNVDAICFGFAREIHLRNEKPCPTFTVGKMCRKVAEKIPYGEDNKVATGIIYGTPTLLNGYSGGPCVDLDYNLLGINVAISGQMTIFVDARVVWNHFEKLSGTKKVKVPFDPTFHIFNTFGESRIAIDKDAKIVNDGIALNLEATLSIIMETIMKDKEANIADWATTKTYFIINGKTYVIYFVRIEVKGHMAYMNRNVFRENENHYIHLCDDGCEVSIDLDEVDA